MKRLLLLTATILTFSAPANAQFSSRVEDNTPTLPSICNIKMDSSVKWSKIGDYIGKNGLPMQAIADKNFEDLFGWMWSDSSTRRGVVSLFTPQYVAVGQLELDEVRNVWQGVGDYDEATLDIDGTEYPLELKSRLSGCKYGNETIHTNWLHGNSKKVFLIPSNTQMALSKAKNVSFVFRTKLGNKTTVFRSAVGKGTLASYRQMLTSN